MFTSRFLNFTTCVQHLFVFVVLVLFSHVSQATDFDALVGIYSVKSPYIDREIDVVKVEKQGTRYIVHINTGYSELEWSSGEMARPAKTENYRDLLANAEFDPSVIGLEISKTVLLRLSPGWNSGPYKTDTGYLWISSMGVLEVRRREAGK